MESLTPQYAEEAFILSLVERAISFQTVSSDPPREYNLRQMHEGLAFLAGQAEELGLFFNINEAGKFPWMCINNVGADQREFALAIMVHFDVVAAQEKDEQGNTINMYEMQIDDTHIYGRGAGDMKSFLGPAFALLKWMKEQGIDLPVGIFVTCDEEIGGKDGTLAMLKDGYRADVVALPDGGFNWNPSVQAKGAERYTITLDTTAGDSARPWENINLLQIILTFLKQLDNRFGYRGDHRALTTVATELHSNGSFGVTPSQLELILDARMFEYDRAAYKAYIERKLNELFEKKGITGVKVKRLSVESFETDARNPLFQAMMHIVENIVGITYPRDENGLVFNGYDTGGSDARFLPEFGNPLVFLMAPDVEDSHGVRERVSRRGLRLYYEFLQQLVLLLLRQQRGLPLAFVQRD